MARHPNKSVGYEKNRVHNGQNFEYEESNRCFLCSVQYNKSQSVSDESEENRDNSD